MFAVPGTKAVGASYEDDYFSAFKVRDATPQVQKYYRDQLEVAASFAQKGRRVFDVGCGDGAFMAVARDAGWAVMGADGSVAGVRHAQEKLGLDARVCDFNAVEPDFGCEAFDVVRAFHVLEHLQKPGLVIRQCARALRPGGTLLVSLPFYLRRRILGHQILYRIGLARHPFNFMLPDHIAYFTPAALRKCLVKHGFELIQTRYSGKRSLWELALQLGDGGKARRVIGKVLSLNASLAKSVYWYNHVDVVARRL